MFTKSRITTLVRKSGKKSAAAVTLVALCATLTGCFGMFPLTKAAHNFNKEASENEFVQSVMFWFMSPFYLLGIVGDVIVLNTVEFWTGKTIDFSSSAADPNMNWQQANAMKATMLDAKWRNLNSPTSELELKPLSEDRFDIVRKSDGALEGYIARGLEGEVYLHSADGALIASLPAPAAR